MDSENTNMNSILARVDEFRSKCIANNEERKTLKILLNTANTRVADLERDNKSLIAIIEELQSKMDACFKDMVCSPVLPHKTFTTNEISSSNEITKSANSSAKNFIPPEKIEDIQTLQTDDNNTVIHREQVNNDISNYFASFHVDSKTINSEENLATAVTLPPSLHMILSSYQSFEKKYLVFVTCEAPMESKDCHFLSIDDLLALPQNADLVEQLNAPQSMTPDGKNLVLYSVIGQLITRMSPVIPKSIQSCYQDAPDGIYQSNELNDHCQDNIDDVKIPAETFKTAVAVKRRGAQIKKKTPAKRRKNSVSSEITDNDQDFVLSDRSLSSEVNEKPSDEKKYSGRKCKVCQNVDHCTRYFKSYQDLDQHLLTVHPLNTFPLYFRCPYGESGCKRHYLSKKSLTQHVKSCHPNVDSYISSDNPDLRLKSLQCTYCGNSFLSCRLLKRHMNELHAGSAETKKISQTPELLGHRKTIKSKLWEKCNRNLSIEPKRKRRAGRKDSETSFENDDDTTWGSDLEDESPKSHRVNTAVIKAEVYQVDSVSSKNEELPNAQTMASDVTPSNTDSINLDEFVLTSVDEISSIIAKQNATGVVTATNIELLSLEDSLYPDRPSYKNVSSISQSAQYPVTTALPCLLDNCIGCDFHSKSAIIGLSLDDEFVSSCRDDILADLYSIPDDPVMTDSDVSSSAQPPANNLKQTDFENVVNSMSSNIFENHDKANAVFADDHNYQTIRDIDNILITEGDNTTESVHGKISYTNEKYDLQNDQADSNHSSSLEKSNNLDDHSNKKTIVNVIIGVNEDRMDIDETLPAEITVEINTSANEEGKQKKDASKTKQSISNDDQIANDNSNAASSVDENSVVGNNGACVASSNSKACPTNRECKHEIDLDHKKTVDPKDQNKVLTHDQTGENSVSSLGNKISILNGGIVPSSNLNLSESESSDEVDEDQDASTLYNNDQIQDNPTLSSITEISVVCEKRFEINDIVPPDFLLNDDSNSTSPDSNHTTHNLDDNHTSSFVTVIPITTEDHLDTNNSSSTDLVSSTIRNTCQKSIFDPDFGGSLSTPNPGQPDNIGISLTQANQTIQTVLDKNQCEQSSDGDETVSANEKYPDEPVKSDTGDKTNQSCVCAKNCTEITAAAVNNTFPVAISSPNLKSGTEASVDDHIPLNLSTTNTNWTFYGEIGLSNVCEMETCNEKESSEANTPSSVSTHPSPQKLFTSCLSTQLTRKLSQPSLSTYTNKIIDGVEMEIEVGPSSSSPSSPQLFETVNNRLSYHVEKETRIDMDTANNAKKNIESKPPAKLSYPILCQNPEFGPLVKKMLQERSLGDYNSANVVQEKRSKVETDSDHINEPPLSTNLLYPIDNFNSKFELSMKQVITKQNLYSCSSKIAERVEMKINSSSSSLFSSSECLNSTFTSSDRKEISSSENTVNAIEKDNYEINTAACTESTPPLLSPVKIFLKNDYEEKGAFETDIVPDVSAVPPYLSPVQMCAIDSATERDVFQAHVIPVTENRSIPAVSRSSHLPVQISPNSTTLSDTDDTNQNSVQNTKPVSSSNQPDQSHKSNSCSNTVNDCSLITSSDQRFEPDLILNSNNIDKKVADQEYEELISKVRHVTVLVPRLAIDKYESIPTGYRLKSSADGKSKRNYPCTICGRSNNSSTALSKHINAHHVGAVGTLTCSVCGFVTLNKVNLANHRRSRHNFLMSEFVQCTICRKSNPNSVTYDCVKALNAHILQNHPNPYPDYMRCPHGDGECDWFWTTLEEFRDHIEICHATEDLNVSLENLFPGQLPWQCFTCGKVYSSDRYLMDHLRKKHNNY